MKTETENFIQLPKRESLLKYGIKDVNGNDTGKYLKFDIERINYPLKLSECIDIHKKNLVWLRDQQIILDKKEDRKGKKFLTWKQEEGMKIEEEFYKKEMEALDLFLGKGATQMILDLYETTPYYSMFEDITKMIKPIMPSLENNAAYIKKKTEDILKKYSNNEESNVLK